MKFLFLILLISLSLHASSDELGSYQSGTKLPKKRFLAILQVFQTEFQDLARSSGRKFEIFSDYNSDWAQAFARRWETDHIIVYGGVAALNGGDEDTMALLLCHETGHLYGGLPYGDEQNRLSLEGQADYWSASCFNRVIQKLGVPGDKRLEKAALALTAFYADNRGIPHPDLSTPDHSQVERTLQTHPEPQCRLDTIMAGMKGEGRPRCWFYE